MEKINEKFLIGALENFILNAPDLHEVKRIVGQVDPTKSWMGTCLVYMPYGLPGFRPAEFNEVPSPGRFVIQMQFVYGYDIRIVEKLTEDEVEQMRMPRSFKASWEWDAGMIHSGDTGIVDECIYEILLDGKYEGKEGSSDY